jgi:purine catabolism regulator
VENPTLHTHARRLGVELGSGAVAICAQAAVEEAAAGGPQPAHEPELPSAPDALLAHIGGGRVLGLVPLQTGEEALAELTAELEERGMEVAVSAPRRPPAGLHEALREAELLVEVASRQDPAHPASQDETYRLLIGVLLRDPDELALLRERTIAPVSTYDTEHDTELLATLQAFLAHHGSTTETAEAMRLHRHTVGYRLTRVHEVSGLSPYESDGRERLSLGLKADQIIEADKRRAQRQ